MPDPTVPSIEILPDRRSLRIGGEEQSVGARAFDVLAYLHKHAGRVVTKAELLDAVWADLTVEESNLTVQIAALRKLLGHRAIATVPGVGYQLTLGPTASPLKSKTLPLPDKPSLAVLPFANLTGDPARDYLVDGIVSDLIAALSRIPAFFVIAASSTFPLKGQSLDLADLGRRLGVRYILEGSIQQARDRLRINTQLVEAETGHTIWSDRLSGAMTEIFELQDEVTERVAGAIEPNVVAAEALRASRKPTTSVSAYDLCLQAAPRALRLADMESFTSARDLLTRAISLDPGYTYAKALVCWLHGLACGSRWITFEEARTILPLAEEVLADHGNDPLALAYAGYAIAYFSKEYERGVSAVKRAYALNPNSSYVLQASGWVHTYIGDADTAAAHFGRAFRLNPLDPAIGAVRSGVGQALYMLGRYPEAVEAFEKAVADAPEHGTSYLVLSLAYWKIGEREKAAEACRRLLAKAPEMTVSGYLKDTPCRVPSWRHDVATIFRALGVPE